MTVRQLRNQVFHGGPVPKGLDTESVHEIVAQNAARINEIYDHGHSLRLEPYFYKVAGKLAALEDYTAGCAIYWPRTGPAVELSDPDILAELYSLVPQTGDRQVEGFASDILRDLRGFAEGSLVRVYLEDQAQIVAQWDLRTSEGPVARFDRFHLSALGDRQW